jgi:hypothetical protein
MRSNSEEANASRTSNAKRRTLTGSQLTSGWTFDVGISLRRGRPTARYPFIAMLEEFNLVTLLMFLLAGGGRDLVSYIPPDAYWEAKGVEVVSVEGLLKDLDPAPPVDVDKAIGALGSAGAAEREAAAGAILSAGPAAIPELEKETASPDVEVARRARALIAQIRTEAKPREVRRLMAMRALGELKDAKALPALRTWAESKEPFAAECARAAIAKIEGKPAPPPRERDAKAFAADVGLLPASCALVMRLAPRPGLAPPFAEAIGQMELPDSTRQQRLRQVARELIDAADRYGNLRVDGVTIGLSGDFNGRNGFVVAILRGQYDPDLAAFAARQERFAATPVNGRNVFQWGPEAHVFLPSADRAVFFAAADARQSPAAALVDAVAKGKGTLRDNAELANLIDAADATQPVWAVGKLTPALQTIPWLDGVDVVRLTSTQTAGRLTLNLSAKGADAARLKSAAGVAEAALKEGLPELEKIAVFMPPLRPLRDAMRSVTLTAADHTLTGTATWSGSLTSLYVFAMYPYTLPAELPK